MPLACRRQIIRSICATAISTTSFPKARWKSRVTLLDLHKVTVPIYNLATREDHIAPAKSVLFGSQYLRRTGEICARRLRPHRGRDQSARQTKVPILDRRKPNGSNVENWLKNGDRASRLVVARLAEMAEGAGRQKPVPARASSVAASSSRSEDAPGSYVKVKSWT